MNNNKIEVMMGIHTHFEVPDANGRIYSKSSIENVLEKYNGENKDMPITIAPESLDSGFTDLLNIPVDKILGYANVSNINLDSMTAKCVLKDTPEIRSMIEKNKISLGFRAVGRIEGKEKVQVGELICLDIIDCTNNPCERITKKNKEDKEMKKKAMISQPMKGFTDEQIKEDRERAIQKLESLGYEVINTLFTDEWYNKDKMAERGVVQIPICFLAKSIENMSLCHAAYFVKGWNEARGCKIEHEVAEAYGLIIIEEGEN